jgi:hypothetical protein
MGKNVIFLLVALLVVTNIGWGLWVFPIHFKSADSTPSHQLHSPTTDWRDYQVTRIQVLKDHPEMAAELKQIQNEIADQRKELNAAMTEADPNIGPILAKLDLAGQPNPPPAPHPAAAPPPHPVNGTEKH